MEKLNLDIFSKVTKEEWIDLAKKQLKGYDPLDQLSWHSDSDLKLEPYYDQSDIEGLSDQINFFKSQKPFHWKLYENVIVDDEGSANGKALEALQGGCDGVIFSVQREPDFDVLLGSIFVEQCDVSFEASCKLEHLPQNLNGYITADGVSNTYSCVNHESQVDMITTILSNISTEEHILRTACTDFFLEIASIRALRFLLYDRSVKDQDGIKIHTMVKAHSDPDQQWFLNTTAGLASILGGSSSISFHTAKGSSRISRNIGNIIREECGISQYSDQCGGSFYVEVLTQKIIEDCRSNLNS